MINRHRTIILSAISLIILMAIGINIRASNEGILFDERVMEYIHNKTTPMGIEIMKKITFFGSSKFFISFGLIVFLFMFWKKNLKGMAMVLFSTLGSYGINFLLKNIFIRTRPLKYFLIEQSGYSFPSGHAMVSMSFYTTMTYLIMKKDKNKKILWILNFLIIALIGFSRIYLGVHWPTDILMGYLLGYVVHCFIVHFIVSK